MKNIYHAVIPDSHTVRHLPALMMIIKESNLDLNCNPTAAWRQGAARNELVRNTGWQKEAVTETNFSHLFPFVRASNSEIDAQVCVRPWFNRLNGLKRDIEAFTGNFWSIFTSISLFRVCENNPFCFPSHIPLRFRDTFLHFPLCQRRKKLKANSKAERNNEPGLIVWLMIFFLFATHMSGSTKVLDRMCVVIHSAQDSHTVFVNLILGRNFI